MVQIESLILKNFKRYKDEKEFLFNEKINILIGDNESGKSTILKALDYIAGGNRLRVERDGIDSILNVDTVSEFMNSEKKYEDLPVVYAEAYFNKQKNYKLNGKNNLKDKECDGLRMKIAPDDEFSKEIADLLLEDDSIFPYDYYKVEFCTFQGDGYTGYRKFIRSLFIDNSSISDEYATRKYVNDIYKSVLQDGEDIKNENSYRKVKGEYSDSQFLDVNNRINPYKFYLKHGRKSNISTDITITEDNVKIEDKGKGRQCFIKTDFALHRAAENVDMIFMEEPENHLSHGNMNKLIDKIYNTESRQLFIATHNNEICTRLDLRNCQIFNKQSLRLLRLNEISEDTAKFFMKASDNNLLRFITSEKVILVEGNAEYILMEKFYEDVAKESSKKDNVSIISVGGLSFKRYLEVADKLDIKTAVIRDNDSDYEYNCVSNYKKYVKENIKVFYSEDNKEKTFEICIYNQNKNLCDSIFENAQRKTSSLDYMINNKCESAYQILINGQDINVPDYIKKGIKWIRS